MIIVSLPGFSQSAQDLRLPGQYEIPKARSSNVSWLHSIGFQQKNIFGFASFGSTIHIPNYCEEVKAIVKSHYRKPLELTPACTAVSMDMPEIVGAMCDAYISAQSFKDLNRWFEALQEWHGLVRCLPGFPTQETGSEVHFVLADAALYIAS